MIQQIWNKQAIDMLPMCKKFIKENGISSQRLIQKIWGHKIRLIDMSVDELKSFDAKTLEEIKLRLAAQ